MSACKNALLKSMDLPRGPRGKRVCSNAIKYQSICHIVRSTELNSSIFKSSTFAILLVGTPAHWLTLMTLVLRRHSSLDFSTAPLKLRDLALVGHNVADTEETSRTTGGQQSTTAQP